MGSSSAENYDERWKDVWNGSYRKAADTSANETELTETYSTADLENQNKFDSTTLRTPSPPPPRSSELSRLTESPNSYIQLTPKEVRVSFHDEVTDHQPVRQRSNASGRSGGIGRGGEDVVVCSSNAAFKRNSTLLRTKTKSRLMDQPEIDQRSSQQKTPKASGVQGKGGDNIEEDDIFLDDDLPDEYKNLRYNKWTLLQLTSLILIITALACTLAIPDFRNKSLFDLEWWKWEVMILVVICGRLVSGWGIRIIVFFIERSFLLRKRVLYFVYGLKKAVQNCIWLALILFAWQLIFNKKVERMTYGKKVLPYVTKIWVCLLVGTVVWLLKTLLIKVLASNFHVSKFFDRIQDSLFNQYVIETLSGPPMIEIQQEQEEEDRMIAELANAGVAFSSQIKANIFKGWRAIGTPRTSTPMDAKNEATKKHDEGITIDHLHRLNQKNISAWNMNRMMNVINTSMLSTLDEQLQDITGDEEDEASVQITSETQAKIAAKRIFSNVAEPESKHIYLEDLRRFLPDDEALRTIRLFDEASETKGISKRVLKNWVVNVFRERRALALSLNDTKTAVDKLHQMLNVVVGIVIIVIWLLILRVATTHFFIFLSSQLVLVAFVFGNTCKTTFEAIIFLFIVHPFDVGDRCEIDGVQMIVEEMNILTTIFLRYDNQKIAYPNSVLASMPIANYHRSPDMGDAIDFCIHVSTPPEKITKMKERITSYVENKSDHWQPGPMIVMRDVDDLNRLKISIWLSHRMNFQDMGERWKRRALLLEELIKIFKDLDIEYRMLPLDINVRNVPGLASSRLPSTWTTCAN
ncbi:mechanosensitive ion channel protein 6-like [Cynara cardunculus var. scolymus]|uniref:mechanosensitive ion channel protein 6-like n=1 Tax=Cynara cardunculus var. scolymus TaxID=59895 RepID=UPI000D624DB4|nr:mechanosensitive ion channel protein 6-like [Cynara cardunculus var. scolymus]